MKPCRSGGSKTAVVALIAAVLVVRTAAAFPEPGPLQREKPDASVWLAPTPGDPVVNLDAPETPKLSDRVGLLDNLSLFGGLDGSKGPEDLGINAEFGFRLHFNWGYPLWEKAGLGVQLGTAVAYSASAVKVLETIEGTNDRTQSFTTLGLFQRTDFGLSWAAAYDYLHEHYYANLDFGQWRAQVGFELRPGDEVGVWGTVPAKGDSALLNRFVLDLDPILQWNLYWRHTWATGVDTRIWGGIAEQHGKFNLVFPGKPPVHDALVFGADIYVPLNDWLAIFGEANYITPNDTGTVTATLGIAFYPKAKALNATRSRFAPVLPVANNPSFAIDADGRRVP